MNQKTAGDNPEEAGRSHEREEQQEKLEETAKKHSWLDMIWQHRREARGKPERRSPANRPWYRWW